jgi:hypothetical protein
MKGGKCANENDWLICEKNVTLIISTSNKLNICSKKTHKKHHTWLFHIDYIDLQIYWKHGLPSQLPKPTIYERKIMQLHTFTQHGFLAMNEWMYKYITLTFSTQVHIIDTCIFSTHKCIHKIMTQGCTLSKDIGDYFKNIPRLCNEIVRFASYAKKI